MNNINVKFLSTRPDTVGFTNGELHVSGYYNDTLSNILSKINDFRSPDGQITSLFTLDHKPVPKSVWNLKLTNSVSFYID